MKCDQLNIGCGYDIRNNWINLDKIALPGVTVVHDIETIPWPFDDSQFQNILCLNVLEHAACIPAMKEIHRILKPGGYVHVTVPHFSSWRNFIDPTHKHMFSVRTFEYFIKNSRSNRSYYFDFSFSRISSLTITFLKKPLYYNMVIEKIINAHRCIKETLFETTALCRLFPAENIEVCIQK